MTPTNAVSTLRTTLGTAGREVRRLAGGDVRVARRAARRGITLPDLPRARRMPGQVWAVTMVRNEIDVLPMVLDHLARQGVDRVLVSDNGSTDGTLEELEAREARGELFLARDAETAYHQAAKMTLLSRAAWRAGADWVVPFDADELWFADQGLLADRLRSLPGDVVGALMVNAFPTSVGGWGMDLSPQVHGKVAFRSHPLATLSQGNHGVDRPGIRLDPATVQLRIAHLPWRSFEQFAAKVRQGARAYEGVSVRTEVGDHWRTLGASSQDALVRDWAAMLAGETVEGMHWSPRGPLLPVDPTTWGSWDPDGRLAGAS